MLKRWYKDPRYVMTGIMKRLPLHWIKDDTYLRMIYWVRFGEKLDSLDLNYPQTFNQKLHWIKLYDVPTLGVRKHENSHCIMAPPFPQKGIANFLLEAVACGRPITMNRANCHETVDDGLTGFLVKERDSDNLIAKIKQFLALTREEQPRKGFNGREKTEKEFDRQIVVIAYMDIINGILPQLQKERR